MAGDRLPLPGRLAARLPLVAVGSLLAALIWSLAPVGALDPAAAAQARRHNTCGRTSVGAPRCGVLWGSYLTPRRSTGASWQAPYVGLETRIGRRFDLVKAYDAWDSHHLFPNAHQQALARGGRLLEVSWNAVSHSRATRISYRRIADGDYDATVVRPQARRLKRWGHLIVVDFQHEMDGRTVRHGVGTPADYRAAFRHIVRVFRSVGARNVKWAWVTTGYRPATAGRYWPGRSFVHWIGYDPYNFYSCHGSRWRSPANLLRPYYRWITSQSRMRGKPIMLGEYGTVDNRRSGTWYRHLPAALKSMPRIKAVTQFGSATSPSCSFRVTDRAATLRGFAAAGRSSSVLGR